jgi:uncharacterized protein YbcV (DUF1398 family)
MNNALKIIRPILFSFTTLVLLNSFAVAKMKHQVGFVKAKEAQRSDYGGYELYHLIGNERKKTPVFYETENNTALINIDGQDILLKPMKKKYGKTKSNRNLIKNVIYKSQLYQVKLKDFTDVTTTRDKKGCGERLRGTMEIVAADGWTKEFQIESLNDICG